MSRPSGGRWRGPVVGLLLTCVPLATSAALVGPAGASSSPPTSTGTNAASTTTTTLTFSEWKTQYGPAVGEIADDALVVFDTGRRNAKHPTAKKVKAIVAACRKWHNDAETLPGKVPPIPNSKMESLWKRLVSDSLAASYDCVAALQNGSKSAAAAFRKKLVSVHSDETALVREFGSTGQ